MWSDCLVFCDCGFQSLCPLMEKDKSRFTQIFFPNLYTAEEETGRTGAQRPSSGSEPCGCGPPGCIKVPLLPPNSSFLHGTLIRMYSWFERHIKEGIGEEGKRGFLRNFKILFMNNQSLLPGPWPSTACKVLSCLFLVVEEETTTLGQNHSNLVVMFA